MPNYFKRPWNESRGDQFDTWGVSVWYFEVADNGRPMRQLEVYQSGVALRYDALHMEDQFGGLAAMTFDQKEQVEFSPYAITAEEFDQAWNFHIPYNMT